MTVAIDLNKVVYTGNAVTTVFPFSFYVPDVTYLQVYLYTPATGALALLTLNVDYTVSGVPGAGGVTYNPLGVPLPATQKLIILRTVPILQGLDINNQGGFYPDTVEAQLDLMTMASQQLEEKLGRAVVADVMHSGQTFPNPSANDMIGWNAGATGLENKTLASLGAVVVSDDVTMAENSPTKVPSQHAAKTYADLKLAKASNLSDLASAPTARNNLATPVYVASLAALKALDVTKDTLAILTDPLLFGVFDFRSSNLSAFITADTTGAVWNAPASAPTGASGAWVRRRQDLDIEAEWCGAQPNTTNDSQPAFQAAYALLAAVSLTTEGIIGRILGLRGKYRLGASLAFTLPVALFVPNFLEYTPTANAAIVIGSATPVGGRNTGYDIQIGGLRAVNGNVAAPTGVNAAGCSGVEIRNCQFSTIRVGRVIAFTKYGVWGNQSNNVYPLQHCQDNVIWLGDIAYCGVGLYTESVSASLGAFQVNEVHVQNSFGNWKNYDCPAGDTNTNNNTFHFNAADADTGGGNININGGWNDYYFGFTDGTLNLRPGAIYNRIFAHNLTFTDNSGNTTNEISDGQNGTVTLKRFKTSGVGSLVRLESTDAGAASAELFELYRNSASPAANDKLVSFSWYHNDDAAVKRKTAEMRVDAPTVAAANLNSRFLWDTTVGNVYGQKMALWQGLTVGAAAADMGAGTLNLIGNFFIAGTQVIGPRSTGWTAGTGSALKGTWAAYAGQTHTGAYVQATIQTLDDNCKNTSQRVKAIEDMLRTHGLIN